MDDVLPSDKHPAQTAVKLGAHFKSGALVRSPLRGELEPVCNALEALHYGVMPWKVRFFALVTGRIPFSYLEISDDD